MRFDLARLAASGVAVALAAAPLAPGAAHSLAIPICGDPGKVTHVPLPGKAPRDPACPTGCHAVMTRRCGLADPAE
jgi:hypothetical protein